MEKVLIAYFSHAGENYVNGAMQHLSIGNTKVAAQMIQEITQGDLFFIDTVNQYPDDHMEKINIAQKELDEQARPELKEYINIEDYDTIFLCYPNWWSTCPMAVFTFLEENDFSNKTILPLCTHEGSGLGHSVQDIQKSCPNSNVLNALAIQGYKVNQAKSIIEKWINENEE